MTKTTLLFLYLGYTLYPGAGTFTTPCINSTKSTVLATKFVNAHNNTNTGAQRVPQCGTANLTNLMKYLNKSGRMYGGCARSENTNNCLENQTNIRIS